MKQVGIAARAAMTPTSQPSFMVRLEGPLLTLGRYQDVYGTGSASTTAAGTAPATGLVSSLQSAMAGVRAFVARNASGGWSTLTGTVRWVENGIVKSAQWVASIAKAAVDYVAAKAVAAWDTVKGWVQEAINFIRNFTATLFSDNKRAKQEQKKAQQRHAQAQRAAAVRAAALASQKAVQARQEDANQAARAHGSRQSLDIQAVVMGAVTSGKIKVSGVSMAEAVKIMDTAVAPSVRHNKLLTGTVSA